MANFICITFVVLCVAFAFISYKNYLQKVYLNKQMENLSFKHYWLLYYLGDVLVIQILCEIANATGKFSVSLSLVFLLSYMYLNLSVLQHFIQSDPFKYKASLKKILCLFIFSYTMLFPISIIFAYTENLNTLNIISISNFYNYLDFFNVPLQINLISFTKFCIASMFVFGLLFLYSLKQKDCGVYSKMILYSFVIRNFLIIVYLAFIHHEIYVAESLEQFIAIILNTFLGFESLVIGMYFIHLKQLEIKKNRG